MPKDKKRKILILADDLTGALDTSVFFVQQGIPTKVVLFFESVDDSFSENVFSPMVKESSYVLVINTETRHSSKEDAYLRIYSLCQKAIENHFSYIYKKTDSALRGNIGSELHAVLHGTGNPILHFIPAFPSSGRTTKNGVQFWNNIPVHLTAFGNDLLNPLYTSQISDIIHSQSQVPVENLSPHIFCDKHNSELKKCFGTCKLEKSLPENFQGIVLWDGETETDLNIIASILSCEQKYPPVALAGCAGFAPYLPALWSVNGTYHPTVRNTPPLVILCGSLHPVSKEQVQFAKDKGICAFSLSPRQKLCPGYYQTEEGQNFLFTLSQTLICKQVLLIDTFDQNEGDSLNFARKSGIQPSSIGKLIMKSLSSIGKYLYQNAFCESFFLTGGDTAANFVNALSIHSLFPICTVGEGTVISKAKYKNKHLQIISKSGGLGEKNIFIKVSELFI